MYVTDQLPKLQALAEHLKSRWAHHAGKGMGRSRLESLDHPHDEGLTGLADLILGSFALNYCATDRRRIRVDPIRQCPPAALHNLTELAQLDLQYCLVKSKRIDGAHTHHREAQRSSRRSSLRGLRTAVTVSFDRSGTQLLVHVQSGNGPSMKPGERSEGLRQFVAWSR